MIVELLSRYARSYDFTKSPLHRAYQKKRQPLKAYGFDFKIKNSFDLYTFEIISRGFENEQAINAAINLLKNQNEDVLRHLNYQERQRFFHQEIGRIVENLPCFSDGCDIYIPYYNRKVNEYLVSDHEALGLKKYQLILKNPDRNQLDIFEQYGLAPYAGDFCDLERLAENDDQVAFYSQEFNLIYFISKEDFQIQELVLKDKWFKGDYTKEQIKTLAGMIIMDENDILIYDYLVQEDLLSDKFIKKTEKKWRK